MTVRDMLTECLRDINVVAYNDTPRAPDIFLALRRFNTFIDDLKAQRLFISKTLRRVYDLVASTASYQIGPTAVAPNWVDVRPEDIGLAGYVDSVSNPTDPTETPMTVLTDAQWARTSIKSQTSTQPTALWYETSFPLGRVWLRPVPTEAGKVALYVPTPMDEVSVDSTGLATALYLPPGYRSMIQSNVALDLCDPFEKVPSPTLISRAALSMSRVAKANIKIGKLRMPDGLSARGGRFKLLQGDEP